MNTNLGYQYNYPDDNRVVDSITLYVSNAGDEVELVSVGQGVSIMSSGTEIAKISRCYIEDFFFHILEEVSS